MATTTPSFAQLRTRDKLYIAAGNTATNTNTDDKNASCPVRRMVSTAAASSSWKPMNVPKATMMNKNNAVCIDQGRTLLVASENLLKALRPLKGQTPETFQSLIETHIGASILVPVATRLLNRLAGAEERRQLTASYLKKLITDTPQITFQLKLTQDNSSQQNTTLTDTVVAHPTPLNAAAGPMAAQDGHKGVDDNSIKYDVKSSSIIDHRPTTDGRTTSADVFTRTDGRQIEDEDELELTGTLLSRLELTFTSYATGTVGGGQTPLPVITFDDFRVLLINLGVHEASSRKHPQWRPLGDGQLERLSRHFTDVSRTTLGLDMAAPIPGMIFEAFCQSLVDLASFAKVVPIDFIHALASMRGCYSSEEDTVDAIHNSAEQYQPSEAFDRSTQNDEHAEMQPLDFPPVSTGWKHDLSGAVVDVPQLLDNAIPLQSSLVLSQEQRRELLKEKKARKAERARIRSDREERRIKRLKQAAQAGYTSANPSAVEPTGL